MTRIGRILLECTKGLLLGLFLAVAALILIAGDPANLTIRYMGY